MRVIRTKKTLSALPLLTVNAGPRDGDKWKDRLKEVPTHSTLYFADAIARVRTRTYTYVHARTHSSSARSLVAEPDKHYRCIRSTRR